MINATVKINLTGIHRGTMALRKNSQSPEMRGLLKRWVLRYRHFLYERYRKFAAGGGTWPALQPSTKKQKAAAGLDNGIMRRTDALFKSLEPYTDQEQGTTVKYQALAVVVGFSGDLHPVVGNTKKRISYADLVAYHVDDNREVLVEPDDQTLEGMSADATNVITELLNR